MLLLGIILRHFEVVFRGWGRLLNGVAVYISASRSTLCSTLPLLAKWNTNGHRPHCKKHHFLIALHNKFKCPKPMGNWHYIQTTSLQSPHLLVACCQRRLKHSHVCPFYAAYCPLYILIHIFIMHQCHTLL